MTHPPSPGEPTKRRAHLSPSCDNLRNIYFIALHCVQARLAFAPSRPLTTITRTATMVEAHTNNGATWRTRRSDCPSTLDFHSCVPEESCPEGTRGAPESKGECRDGACVLISEKTHVWDVANRAWLLPFIADKATKGPERDILLTLIRHASAHQPEHRPSFAEMVEHLDRFEKQKRGN